MAQFADLNMKEVRDAILNAFQRADLNQLLTFEFNKGLAYWVAPGSFNNEVFELLEEFRQRGWERQFLNAVYHERPSNPDIKTLYETAKLSPDASVQEAGLPVAATPTSATDAGLEKVVRKRLPFLNVAVWNEKLSEISTRVCQITRQDAPQGTGFLIGPDLVLTNYHVVHKEIDAGGDAGTLKCRFDYKVMPDGTASAVTSVKLRAGTLADWAPDFTPYTPEERKNQPQASVPTIDQLDFALLRLERKAANEPLTPGADASNARLRGSIPIPAGTASFTPDDPLLIVQHPGDAAMKLAIDTSSIIGLNGNGTRVRYKTNTENGSSGSPCFDFEWNLIALHHYGDPAYGHPKYNQGIPIGMILARLKSKGLL
jgi:hypothetical protein